MRQRSQITTKLIYTWATENEIVLLRFENPREIGYQHRWSVNVWYGIIGHQIIGLYFITRWLTGQTHSTFCSETLPVLSLIRLTTWYQYDGCPAHYAHGKY